MNVIFIAGTDTGVGKTIVTGLLGRYLVSRGRRVVTQKWVQTGAGAAPGQDMAVHLKLMGKSAEDFGDSLPLMNPYFFRFAASPHLAARLENKPIDAAKIKRSVKKLSRRFDLCLIEGTGGLLVPFDDGRLLIDIVKELKIPVLVVAKNSLGAINHTLLSIEALKNRGIEILGIVFNNISKCEDKVILRDNKKIIGRLSKQTIIGELPWAKNFGLLYAKFKPLGARIISRLREVRGKSGDTITLVQNRL
ncbi:MAG: dethiobiotin synthase [Candidatus Omnitrophota bacterium]|nr:dethiobiotin synthase [Candidatus Omnitrophota bacterium]